MAAAAPLRSLTSLYLETKVVRYESNKSVCTKTIRVDAEGNNVEEETTCIPFVPHAVDQEYPGLEVEGWEEF